MKIVCLKLYRKSFKQTYIYLCMHKFEYLPHSNHKSFWLAPSLHKLNYVLMIL